MNRLAIVGTHERTRSQAPFDDPAYDIWVFNEAPQADWVKRWDACFQMHKREVYTSEKNFVRADHWRWLQEHHGARRIYMQDDDPRVPNSVRYPLEEVLQSIPGAQLKWFKSSAAYAIALALYLGYEQIALYGLDMASNTEYGYQLPNYQFWVGVAYGMGVTIELISNEQYFSGSLYGYEGELQIERGYFARRADELGQKRKSAKFQYEKARGRLNEALQAGRFDKAFGLIAECQDAAMQLGEITGGMIMAQEYGDRADPIPRQQFERRAAQAQIAAEEKRKEMWIAHGETQYVWNVWRQTGRQDARDQFIFFVDKQLKAAEECGTVTGAMKENMSYMQQVDDLITAAGGQRTVAALAGGSASKGGES